METNDALLASITPTNGRNSRTILDPATGEAVGEAPVHTVEDLEAAITAAAAAQPAWAALGHDARSAALMKAADAVERSAEELARLLSREQGKPLNGPNARFEVGACAAWLRATAATPLDPETVVDDGETHAELHYRPIGVVGAIGPWNWPMMITIWQIAPALRMGNAVVVKPSEYTPLSVLALAKIINEELPDGLLTVVSGGRDVGARLAEHPAIGKVMFTGSTATGKAIIRSSADTVKRLTLELGGNDAGIVLPDADPKAIAEDLFWGAFINTGQTCAALKRLYVHEDIYDAVCEELTEVAAAMPMGPGLDENNVLGPLQNKAQFDIVARLVDAARDSGARILLGGNPDPERPGYFYPTTWWPTSTTTTRSSPRNSSAQPCPSSATAPSTRPSPRQTRSTSDSAPRSGPPTPPRPAPSPPASKQEPSGSTSTAPSIPASPSGARSSRAMAWNSAPKASKPSACHR